MLCICHLEILYNLWASSPALLFCTGPAHYVAYSSSISGGDCYPDLWKWFSCLPLWFRHLHVHLWLLHPHGMLWCTVPAMRPTGPMIPVSQPPVMPCLFPFSTPPIRFVLLRNQCWYLLPATKHDWSSLLLKDSREKKTVCNSLFFCFVPSWTYPKVWRVFYRFKIYWKTTDLQPEKFLFSNRKKLKLDIEKGVTYI